MFENIRLAFRGIHSHRLRAVLTMLGIVIGIASIIVIVSLITGTTEQLKTSMINSGDDTINVTLYNKNDIWSFMDPMYNGLPEGVYPITSDVVEQVEDMKGVIGATPVYKSEYGVNVSYNGQRHSATVVGAEKKYFGLKNYVLTSGRYFIDRDYEDRNNVAVITFLSQAPCLKMKAHWGKRLLSVRRCTLLSECLQRCRITIILIRCTTMK